MNGRSAVLAYEPTGKVVQQVNLAPQYFGEGIVDWGPYLYEWTWQSHVCLVYERATLNYVKQFAYAGEGWGMTRNEHEIVTSDGSSMLRFRDPETFHETRRIVVRDNGRAIENLNELEWVEGGGLRECLAHGPDCADLAGGWACAGVDRSNGAAAGRTEGG